MASPGSNNLYEGSIEFYTEVFVSSFYFGSFNAHLSGGHFFDYIFVICYNYAMLKKFPYVEDYIEIINGDRSPATGKLYGLFDNTSPIVSLARYDVAIVNSMSAATTEGRSLTDKQAALACKIVLKYRKQLTNLGIDVAPVENPQYRLSIRIIDRVRRAYVDRDSIALRFPYDPALIDYIRELAKISQGAWKFDSGDAKVWRLSVTETNVVAAYGFAKINNFEIDPEFEELVQLVTDCESRPYEIKLTPSSEGYTITNAENSLTNYINNWCGFNPSSIDQLVDNSAILGYTVDATIEQQLASKYSARIYNLMTQQETKFSPTPDTLIFEDIITYAGIVGRWPLYVYEPDMSDRLYEKFVCKYFQENDVYRVKDLRKEPITVGKKIIYFNKFNPGWTQPIPLLLSTAGMMHGGEKSMLLQRAEKVVYFAADVYNNQQRRA